jgi:hypothetical protein
MVLRGTLTVLLQMRHDGQIICFCLSELVSIPSAKYIPISSFQKSCLYPSHPASTEEGRRDRHGRWKRGAVDAWPALDERLAIADGEAAWSWPPDAEVKFADDEFAGDGD